VKGVEEKGVREWATLEERRSNLKERRSKLKERRSKVQSFGRAGL
jgi:hypothetical protein